MSDDRMINIGNPLDWERFQSVTENDAPLATSALAARHDAQRHKWPAAILVPIEAATVDALERWARQHGARYAGITVREAVATAIEAALRSVASVAVAGNRTAGFDTEALDPDGLDDPKWRLDDLDYEIEEMGYDIEEGERALATLRADLADRRAERERFADGIEQEDA